MVTLVAAVQLVDAWVCLPVCVEEYITLVVVVAVVVVVVVVVVIHHVLVIIVVVAVLPSLYWKKMMMTTTEIATTTETTTTTTTTQITTAVAPRLCAVRQLTVTSVRGEGFPILNHSSLQTSCLKDPNCHIQRRYAHCMSFKAKENMETLSNQTFNKNVCPMNVVALLLFHNNIGNPKKDRIHSAFFGLSLHTRSAAELALQHFVHSDMPRSLLLITSPRTRSFQAGHPSS